MVSDPPPDAVRERLLRAGAQPGFHGMMVDQRYDRDGRLAARDEVLRLRILHHQDGPEEVRLSWKGPVGVTREGYKSRRELEYQVQPLTAAPSELLLVLGFEEVQRIERYVEYYRLGSAAIRLEWYPRMDILIEVEGDEPGIEAALRVIGIPRTGYTPEPLIVFAARYAARTGVPAALTVAELGGESPSWERR